MIKKRKIKFLATTEFYSIPFLCEFSSIAIKLIKKLSYGLWTVVPFIEFYSTRSRYLDILNNV